MTKEEFLKRWGYQSANGFSSVLFDCREQLLKDLEELIKNLAQEKNPPTLTKDLAWYIYKANSTGSNRDDFEDIWDRIVNKKDLYFEDGAKEC